MPVKDKRWTFPLKGLFVCGVILVLIGICMRLSSEAAFGKGFGKKSYVGGLNGQRIDDRGTIALGILFMLVATFLLLWDKKGRKRQRQL
ncbi:hypothetical protein [Ferruginibacter sp.]